MNISNPRRILLLSFSEISVTPVLDSLLSSKLDNQHGAGTSSTASTAAGDLIHKIVTPYYSASVPIWQDTIVSIEDWTTEWKAMQGASEVIRAVAAWICVFERPRDHTGLASIKALLQGISSVISHHDESDPYSDSGDSDAILLAVGLPQRQLPALELTDEQWDEACQCDGGSWEYIDSEGQGKNEFGELRGHPRLREALESAEWDGGDPDTADADLDDDNLDQLLDDMASTEVSDENVAGNDITSTVDEDHGLQAELKKLIGAHGNSIAQPMLRTSPGNDPHGLVNTRHQSGIGLEGGDDGDLEDLQQMLLKLRAARDLGADLPKAERRKLAAKAVKEVMRM